MPELLRTLRQEHERFTGLLDALDWQIEQIELGRSADYELIREILAYFLKFPDLEHHPKEDLLYTKLRERAPQEIAALLDLAREHVVLARKTRDFADAISAVLDDALMPRDALVNWGRQFIDHQRAHIAGEETIFFRTAELKLDAADWEDLRCQFFERRVGAAKEAARMDYEALSRTMLGWQAEQAGSAASPSTSDSPAH